VIDGTGGRIIGGPGGAPCGWPIAGGAAPSPIAITTTSNATPNLALTDGSLLTTGTDPRYSMQLRLLNP